MKILIAVDSFKDSLSSFEAGMAIRRGIMNEFPDFEINVVPVADGGEGTAEALMEASAGKRIPLKVFDPLMRVIESSFIIMGDGETAVIEMASASGLELLDHDERNPWIATSFGTGQLIAEALNRECRRVIIALGGSATNDAGVGMAKALGVKFLDKNKKEVGIGGGELVHIRSIDVSGLDKRIAVTEFIAACDVTNPLTGISGASFVYGPQKGADKLMTEKLDANLKHYANLILEQTGKEIDSVQGAGAAGGLGAGLLAYTGATLKPGFEIVRNEIKLDEKIRRADLIITGEGKLDSQTKYGKTPIGVAGVAKIYSKPVIAIAGTLGEGYQELYNYGFNAIFSILDKPMTLDEALITAPNLLERCGRNIIRLWITSKHQE